ncbi:MAG: acetyl-CoA carboxylase biotin carboxylase subunit [candidate division Zixibacteria bacterium]|nr:acetyl-CoA carboxylase biotin carboxylase subunit [candidate division Zixibacteria bacterium]
MKNTIKKILIANRGEIAVRIARACRDLGIESVAVFSDCDKTAYHVRMADEACHIGPSPSTESYLVHDKIIKAAKESHADAIHPGYGFLSENADFAKRCADEGIIFIGPNPDTIALLGDKLQARAAALEAGLPVVPGDTIDQDSLSEAVKKAQRVGFPVLIKAAAGGGGKGMRVVERPEDFEENLQRASSEATSAFGDGRVFIERYLIRPRHIEIQILGDRHGNCIYLGERECSIQRRHQKVIEEAPSPVVTPELREKMGKAAVSIAKKTGYVGAGTVEFMVDKDLSFYFLEVNTRLQVEHPVTEMVTGVDLVKEQIAVAEGIPLRYRQDDITLNGHAIECRIYAEDPDQGFVPSTGKLKNYRIPAGPGVRVDSGVVIFNDIPIFYDPMIAKLIVWGSDRTEAIGRTKRALEEYRLSGLRTTIGFHRTIMDNPRFIKGDLSTSFLSDEYPDNKFTSLNDETREAAAIAAALDKFTRERKITVDNRNDVQQTRSGWTAYHRRTNLKHFGGSR